MNKKTKKLIFSRFIAGESVNYLSYEFDLTISAIENIIRNHLKQIDKDFIEERGEFSRRFN